MLITSRGYTGKRFHYALLCSSDEPLDTPTAHQEIDASAARNFVSGNRVGASQVTSVVRYDRSSSRGTAIYPISFRAGLVGEGFVRLVDPVPLADDLIRQIDSVCVAETVDAWLRDLRQLRGQALAERRAI